MEIPCRNKGFVFTIDAVFAVIAVVFLMGALVLMQEIEKGKESLLETAAQKMRDVAMVDYYTAKNTCNNGAITEQCYCGGTTWPAGSGYCCEGAKQAAPCPPPESGDFYYSTTVLEYELPDETVMPRPPISLALVVDSSASMDIADILFKEVPEKDVSGGTCSGGNPCNASNCGNPDKSSMPLLGTINIDSAKELSKIKKDISAHGAYAGNCSNPKIMMKSPSGNYYPLSFISTDNCIMTAETWATGGYSGDCCYATAAGGCTGAQAIRPWPSLQAGTWEIYGWADGASPVTFGSIDFYGTRIDAVKKAAKSFIENPGWKAGDVFGLVGFSNNTNWVDPGETVNHYTSINCGSSSITTCLALTGNIASIKSEIEKMTPAHGTTMPAGIDRALSILSTGSPTSKRYIILLTDGQTDPAPFISKANEARNNYDTTIYIIGFAAESLLLATVPGSVPPRTYEDAMKEAAKDGGTAYCGETDEYCGKYYFAKTGAELNSVYQQIASEITSSAIGAQGQIIRVRKVGG